MFVLSMAVPFHQGISKHFIQKYFISIGRKYSWCTLNFHSTSTEGLGIKLAMNSVVLLLLKIGKGKDPVKLAGGDDVKLGLF